jgi:DNA polymerase elongation subunit (family B)
VSVSFGNTLTEEITARIGKPPIKLMFESCLCNLVLQAVNRYAAKTCRGGLLAKGLETDRRDVPGLCLSLLSLLADTVCLVLCLSRL